MESIEQIIELTKSLTPQYTAHSDHLREEYLLEIRLFRKVVDLITPLLDGLSKPVPTTQDAKKASFHGLLLSEEYPIVSTECYLERNGHLTRLKYARDLKGTWFTTKEEHVHIGEVLELLGLKKILEVVLSSLEALKARDLDGENLATRERIRALETCLEKLGGD